MHSRILAAATAAILSCSAQAALITEHWTSTIYSFVNTTGLSDGVTFTWSVTFDDAGVRMTTDLDGPDGVANTADDYLSDDLCLRGFADGCIFDNSYLATYGWTSLSDAVFDIQLPTYGFKSAQASLRDFYNSNHSRAWSSSVYRNREFIADNFYFRNSTSRGYMYDHREGGWMYVEFSSELTAVTHAGVPAPLTLSLLGIGLAGLGWSRLKRS